jgi:serpin B
LISPRVLAAIVLLAGISAVSLGYFNQSELPRENNLDVSNEELMVLVGGNNEFAFELYREIRDGEGNLFYSPYSISLALAMAYAGARGETERQMADTLNFTLPQARLHPAFNALDQLLTKSQNENFILNIANAFWGQKDFHFEAEFLDTLALNYGSGVHVLDFVQNPEAARVTINDWVEKQTENRIKNLIPPGVIDHFTRAVLTNAVYFNASWRYPFLEEATQDSAFTLLDGKQVTVPMMSQTEIFRYAEGEDYQAVELPYCGEKASMLIILPARSQFIEFEETLAERVHGIINDLDQTAVKLKMPKFKFEASMALSEMLADMGMPAAFDPDKADFSGMTGDRSLWIDKVLHKAFVSVDERGTEAAAGTAVIMVLSAIVPEVEVSIDHPFIFLVRDNETGAILFMGRVLDLTACY